MSNSGSGDRTLKSPFGSNKTMKIAASYEEDVKASPIVVEEGSNKLQGKLPESSENIPNIQPSIDPEGL